MKKTKLLIVFTIALLFSMRAGAQKISSFEEFTLPSSGYLNGSDFSGGFQSGSAYFLNYFDTTFGAYWEGFSISNKQDSSTKGWANQYSAITGGAIDGNNYAVFYTDGYVRLTDAAKGKAVKGFYITNSTYAYYDMKEGSTFSKKFGGKSGNDPDYFGVFIQAFRNDSLLPMSETVYLADFRDADNTQDYILNTWEWVTLEGFGVVDSFEFTFISSDTGSFGINTPQYFCMDLFNSPQLLSVQENMGINHAHIYPNPVSNKVFVDSKQEIIALQLFDMNGSLLLETTENMADVSMLHPGIYILSVRTENGIQTSRIIKE